MALCTSAQIKLCHASCSNIYELPSFRVYKLSNIGITEVRQIQPLSLPVWVLSRRLYVSCGTDLVGISFTLSSLPFLVCMLIWWLNHVITNIDWVFSSPSFIFFSRSCLLYSGPHLGSINAASHSPLIAKYYYSVGIILCTRLLHFTIISWT